MEGSKQKQILLELNISLIALNENGLNVSIKRAWQMKFFLKINCL